MRVIVSDKYAVVAIHDVCPKYFSRVVRLSRLLSGLGVRDFSFLVIPRRHDKDSQDIRARRDFAGFLKAQERDLVMHGVTHFNLFLDDEFTGVKYAAALRRLEQGAVIFKEAFGFKPAGFIPPMWMLNRASLHAVTDAGFEYTSTQKFFYDLKRGEKQKSTVVLRGGLLFFPSLLNSVFKTGKSQLIQIALHPQDSLLKQGVMKRLIQLAGKRGYKFVSYGNFINEVC